MENNNTYSINYSSLPIGKYCFNFDIDALFFSKFEYGEIKSGHIKIALTLEKKTRMALADFIVLGNVKTECDRCLDEIDMPITGNFKLVIKEAENDADLNTENEDLIVIPINEHYVNFEKQFYEFIHLLLPMHRECADTPKRECNPSVVERLNQISTSHQTIENSDPRWAALQKLTKNNNN